MHGAQPNPGISGLRVAIWEQAIKDYRKALYKYRLTGNKDPELKSEIKELEEFFLSDWGELCGGGISGKKILMLASADCDRKLKRKIKS